jgi:hypothetical protein
VCTGHYTVHCPVHRLRTLIHFLLCAVPVRWFTGQLLCAIRCAPDMHCRLSGAPITRFKKRSPVRASSQRPPFTYLCSGSLLSSVSSSPPANSSSPPATNLPLCSPSSSSGELLSPSLFTLCFKCPVKNSLHLSPFLIQFKLSSKSCESKLLCRCLVPYWITLQVLSSLGRVSPPQMAISPKT